MNSQAHDHLERHAQGAPRGGSEYPASAPQPPGKSPPSRRMPMPSRLAGLRDGRPDGEVKKGATGTPRCRTTAPPRRTTHSQEKARSLPVDPVVRFGFTGGTGIKKKIGGPSILKALQSDPRTVYSTLNDSHRTLFGQTTTSSFWLSIAFAGEPA